jgi:hypothetical protein
MSDLSPILSLPYIMPAQAQKHVTHNEAIRLLDLMVQMTVADRTRSEPPATPAIGARHIVGPSPAGDWAGQAGRIALREENAWAFFAPQEGWRAQVLAEGRDVVFDGTAWIAPTDRPLRVPQLGVNAASDAVNRIAVSSAATLLTHEGAGHQVKINKFQTSDTASLLYQTNWSGRAEIGLAGADDLTVKVSADGTTFVEALQVAADTGAVRLSVGALVPDGTAALPALRFAADPDTGLRRAGTNQIGFVAGGVQRASLSATALQVDVPVTGSAVQTGSHDATAGRVARNFATGGLFGWGVAQGGSLGTAVVDANAAVVAGLYATSASTVNLPPVPAGTQVGLLEVLAGSGGDALHQRWTTNSANGNVRSWQRRSLGGVWQTWALIFNQSTVLGTVSTVAGQPTRAVIERGSNANGEFVRFADGTQICTRSGLSAAAVSTALGAVFRSGDVTWTYPAAFAAAPVVSGQAEDIDAWLTAALPGTTNVSVRLLSAVSKTAATALRVTAVGRWL